MFLLNTHRETNCSHNPTGPPREFEVFIPFAPEAARTAHHWFLQMPWVIKSSLLQCKDLLSFSLNWADVMFQGTQEAMAPSVGMKLLFLQFLAIDEMWQGWSPISASAKSLPSPPWGQVWGQCPALLLPHDSCPVTWELHVRSGNTTQAASLQRLFTCFKCQLGYFSPSPTLPLLFPSSFKILT